MSHFYYQIIHSDVKRCEQEGDLGVCWMGDHIVFQDFREYYDLRWSLL